MACRSPRRLPQDNPERPPEGEREATRAYCTPSRSAAAGFRCTRLTAFFRRIGAMISFSSALAASYTRFASW
jgi:hypothetical protein